MEPNTEKLFHIISSRQSFFLVKTHDGGNIARAQFRLGNKWFFIKLFYETEKLENAGALKTFYSRMLLEKKESLKEKAIQGKSVPRVLVEHK